jgi:hypothetical protein
MEVPPKGNDDYVKSRIIENVEKEFGVKIDLEKKLEIECPQCGLTLVIDINGRVVETRRPKREYDWRDAMMPSDEG